LILRSLHAVSISPALVFGLLHPLSAAEAHIAFALAAAVAIIGVCRLLLGLARDWREYRAGR
jgi:hypothetical protein